MRFIKKVILTLISVFVVFPFVIGVISLSLLKNRVIPDVTFVRFFFWMYCKMSDIIIDSITSEKKCTIEDVRAQMITEVANDVFKTIPDKTTQEEIRKIFEDTNVENKVRTEDPEFDKLMRDYEKVLKAEEDKNERDKE